MTTFAYIFRVGQSEQDFLMSVGLLIATIIFSFFTVKQIKAGTSNRPRLVSTLALIGLIATIWALIDAVIRFWASVK